MERIVSALLLLIVSPLILILSLLIIISSGRPVFFRQSRVGKGGRIFTILKFRTMIRVHSGLTVSVKNETRITRVGSFLRKWKLDELPELINILRGEMAFVGPRPDVPGYADKLEGNNRDILLLKPGLTGPASLKYIDEENILSKVEDPKKYNDEIIYPDKVRINLIYLKRKSLIHDLKILMYTITRKKWDEY